MMTIELNLVSLSMMLGTAIGSGALVACWRAARQLRRLREDGAALEARAGALRRLPPGRGGRREGAVAGRVAGSLAATGARADARAAAARRAGKRQTSAWDGLVSLEETSPPTARSGISKRPRSRAAIRR